METIEFIKMHGLGNDFVVIDGRSQPIENKEELAIRLNNRQFGVGCDQLVFLLPPQNGGDVLMRMFNSDGSEPQSCGNASRCIADIVMKETGKTQIALETISGTRTCWRAEENQVTVDMGEPRLDWQQIPLSKECDTFNLPLGGNGVSNPVAVNMGNPHCVFFVDDVDQIDLTKTGRMFEYDPIFPERANIEFVEIVNKGHVKMRVWERGSGITLACGSGACATAVAAIRRGLTGHKVIVEMDGGSLTLEWRESDNHVYMTGPVAYVFRGKIN